MSVESLLLATGGYDYSIRLWEAHTGFSWFRFVHADKQVNSLAVSSDKQYLVAGGNPTVRLYDVKARKQEPLVTYEGHSGNVTELGFQRTRKWMYTGSDDGTLKIWDLRSRSATLSFDNGSPINTVALHPNQAELITGDADGAIKVWDLTAGRCMVQLQPEKEVPVSSVTMAVDASLLVAALYNGCCYVWNPSSSGDGSSPRGGSGSAPAPAPTAGSASAPAETDASADRAGGEGGDKGGEVSSVGEGSTGKDGAVAEEMAEVGDFAAGYTPVKRLRAHRGYILRCCLSPDAQTLATTSCDSTVKLWNVRDFSLTNTLAGHERWVWDCAFSADSSFLVSASSDAQARLWDCTSGETVRTYGGHGGHTKAITAVALSDASPS